MVWERGHRLRLQLQGSITNFEFTAESDTAGSQHSTIKGDSDEGFSRMVAMPAFHLFDSCSSEIAMNEPIDRFGEGYFERGEGSGYVNYSWRPHLIWPRVQAIIHTTAIQPPNKILDFGCAKGFYVRCLRREGYQAFGIDVSTYALSHAPEDARPFLSLTSERGLSSFGDREFDLTIAKDVLEHLTVNELRETVEGLCRISKKLIVTVPICGANRRYINEGDELDVTHSIRLTLKEWMDLLGATIYNSALCVNLKAEKSRGTLCTIIDVHVE
jgi:hypothetical protein